MESSFDTESSDRGREEGRKTFRYLTGVKESEGGEWAVTRTRSSRHSYETLHAPGNSTLSHLWKGWSWSSLVDLVKNPGLSLCLRFLYS